MPGELAIDAEGLEKSYGDVHALAGVDLRAPVGSVLGLLGPNGAGKTTAVRILTTLLVPTPGAPAWRGWTSSPTPQPCAHRSGWRASTRRSTRTSPARRTSRWWAGSTTSAAPSRGAAPRTCWPSSS